MLQVTMDDPLTELASTRPIQWYERNNVFRPVLSFARSTSSYMGQRFVVRLQHYPRRMIMPHKQGIYIQAGMISGYIVCLGTSAHDLCDI
ncbi:hypothetical protein BDQ17DRAFT_1343594 [Cyathus striatus]|nr:hypothetical protein BDQ17DRAFT_1343594 [Cyathus striatus]